MTDKSHRKADPVPTPAIRTVTPTAGAAPKPTEKPKHAPDTKADARTHKEEL